MSHQPPYRASAVPAGPGDAGFTLIELMITVAIVAVIITVGVPSLTEFVAMQRVRTAVSDTMADIAFARAEAIKESRPAIMERLAGATGTWKDGWRVCVDIDNSNTCTAAEDRKRTEAFGGRVRVCSTATDFDNRIIFRPDGRVSRPNAPGANDGLKVSDDLGDGVAGNDFIRSIVIGISGRPLVIKQDAHTSGGTLCP
ncbi:MAG: GspH/FimT family pseudopilin [Burkholderiales bacterium]|nr:GspH/FimT family pseudopilin [Burkholderiales bacterium]